jgi:uroporphyrinogen-III decarboxylase
MLQVFESHAECLSPYLFSLYAFPHLEEIAVRVKQRLGKDAVPMVSHSIDFRTWEDE